MATGEVSVTGRLLARLRAERRLTAADLAELVPDAAISKTVITNVESGRKRDLTVTELMQISSALDVTPLALMVDFREPWAPVETPSLAEPYRHMTVLDYVAESQPLAIEAIRSPDEFWGIGPFVDALRGAESAIAKLEEVRASVQRGDAWERSNTAWRLVGDESGESYLLSELDSPVRATYQSVVFEYRALLRCIAAFSIVPIPLPQFRLPDSIWERVNRVGDVIAEILTDVPIPSADYEREPLPDGSDVRELRARLRHPGQIDQVFEVKASQSSRRRAASERG